MIAYRKAVLGALRDVEDALSRSTADRGAAGRAASKRCATPPAPSNCSDTRYRGGLVTLCRRAQAQQARRLSLEKQVVETKGALARDTVALVKALGGGWPELAQGGAAMNRIRS